jgi:hypothetical protein
MHDARFRSFICHRLPALAAGAAALMVTAAAHAAGVTVPMDEVRIVTFKQPVATVFVGNPLIADITVIDATRVFVLGKNFGTTNLVTLDADGNQLANEQVQVTGRAAGTVTLHRGTAQTTYACAATNCRPAPIPGDASASFDAVNGQITTRESMGQAAAKANR